MGLLEDALPPRGIKRGAAAGAVVYTDVFDMEPMERIRRIERGLPPAPMVRLANAMGRSKASVASMMGLAVSTVDRKAQKGERLSPDQSERIMGLKATSSPVPVWRIATDTPDHTAAFSAAAPASWRARRTGFPARAASGAGASRLPAPCR